MSQPAAIRVEGLRFLYPGVEVLHDVSFSINSGEVTGLIGPNGAGTSTTLRILTGMLEPSSGRVDVAGCALPTQAFELKQRIGYVPEAAELYETRWSRSCTYRHACSSAAVSIVPRGFS